MHIHTQWNITQALKKEILLFTTTWVKLEGIILSEISQTEKGQYHMISLVCLIERPPMMNSQIQRMIWWLPEVGVGKMGEGGQKIQTSGYKDR